MAWQAVIQLQGSHHCAIEALVHVELLNVLCTQLRQMLRNDSPGSIVSVATSSVTYCQ